MMKLKIKQIAFLIAGLGASTASLAAGVTPTEIEEARSGGTLQQAWITGASAPTISIYEAWVRGCDANTNSIFTAGTSTTVTRPGAIGNFSAYACRRQNAVSVLYHTVDGGSLNAYTPHTIGSVLARVRVLPGGNDTCVLNNTGYTDESNSANNATLYRSCKQIGVAWTSSANNATNTTALATDPNGPQLPIGGYSDVEASFFSPQIGGGNVASVGDESDVGVGQAFAVAVSVPLYRALQAQQSLTQNDDIANAPNITSGQYTNLITSAGLLNWSSLLSEANGANKKLILARRVDTSGTQAASNAFFLKNPCSNGVNQSLFPTTASNNVNATGTSPTDVGGYTVSLLSSTGNVKTALSTASGKSVSDPNSSFAIGVMSAENSPAIDGALGTPLNYRFVKLDGVHPEDGDALNARKSSAEGKYKFHMEMKQFLRADYNGKPAKSTFEASILTAMTSALKNPPTNLACSTFPRGLTLNPANGSICTIGTEVARMTNAGQNCSANVQYY